MAYWNLRDFSFGFLMTRQALFFSLNFLTFQALLESLSPSLLKLLRPSVLLQIGDGSSFFYVFVFSIYLLWVFADFFVGDALTSSVSSKHNRQIA
jgi:hypothetical protein